ncbi:hypothetical protein HU200_021784 [Digitaria exilis]|uniref:Uncharacterized protein n=1 Tax=Digitaria exilis TaxID=1010633 RepID=A0A835EYU3_9POAL|nr:hypothetical protein HU200_021784 [Digitaria exilis]
MASLTAVAPLKFTVAPAAPTPRELKVLSDIDDQESVRVHVPGIFLYRRNESMAGRDPVAVIRDAVARALVHYYPLVGRLREVEGGKLAVDCTGEGQLGEPLLPPFPCLHELLFDVPGSSAIINAPLMLFQSSLEHPRKGSSALVVDIHFPLRDGGFQTVYTFLGLHAISTVSSQDQHHQAATKRPRAPTDSATKRPRAPTDSVSPADMDRISFILGVRVNQTMADGLGMVQFGGALAELARGAPAPTVKPVWERELLMARDPPRPSFAHREYDEPEGTDDTVTSLDDLAHRCFFFTPRDVATLRDLLLEAPQLRATATTFDCRTAALAPAADVEMRMMCAINVRGITRGAAAAGGARGIPRGYYGNAAVCSVAVSAAGELCANPVSYAVELVKKAKEEVDMEYIRSAADLVVLRGRPPLSFMRTYVVSDVRKAPAGNLDFGWGRPVYGGPAEVGGDLDRGEELGIAVPVCLPRPAMERFAEEMGKLLQRPLVDVAVRQHPRSAL